VTEVAADPHTTATQQRALLPGLKPYGVDDKVFKDECLNYWNTGYAKKLIDRLNDQSKGKDGHDNSRLGITCLAKATGIEPILSRSVSQKRVVGSRISEKEVITLYTYPNKQLCDNYKDIRIDNVFSQNSFDDGGAWCHDNPMWYWDGPDQSKDNECRLEIRAPLDCIYGYYNTYNVTHDRATYRTYRLKKNVMLHVLGFDGIRGYLLNAEEPFGHDLPDEFVEPSLKRLNRTFNVIIMEAYLPL
tara:strand:+ start:660 stop:1394 length:735 start_codon:yes stop_codon:yes gene_type:complete